MAIEDRETVICLNRADMKEGSPISTQHQPTSVIKFKIGLFVVFRRRGCLLLLYQHAVQDARIQHFQAVEGLRFVE